MRAIAQDWHTIRDMQDGLSATRARLASAMSNASASRPGSSAARRPSAEPQRKPRSASGARNLIDEWLPPRSGGGGASAAPTGAEALEARWQARCSGRGERRSGSGADNTAALEEQLEHAVATCARQRTALQGLVRPCLTCDCFSSPACCGDGGIRGGCGT